MLFNSLHFLLFFPVALTVFHIIPPKLRSTWLLLCSYYFYMAWNAKYALLLLFSTAVTYVCGIGLNAVVNAKRLTNEKKSLYKKIILAAGVAVNLAVLFFFKYFNLFFDAVAVALKGLGIGVSSLSWNVLLPVGISFYTFQAVGYTIDVYRGDIAAERNFLRYALFVSFFPQLVAGPIERSSNLLGELKKIERSRAVVSWERFRHGFLIMMWGFFIKMVVADRIAVFVDHVFGAETPLAGAYVAVAVLLFAVQIYGDFAGYSIIAAGAAEMLGIKLMRNFETPYLSLSVKEFWRRWHVSLSSWFRDYLYIPLGGSRKGTWRKYVNLMIVFALSGLWHGAEWSFVIWGLLNGLYQVVEDMILRIKVRLFGKGVDKKAAWWNRALRALTTFILIDFSWIFFRADNMTQAVGILRSLFLDFKPQILIDGSLFTCGLNGVEFGVMLISIAVLLVADLLSFRGVQVADAVEAKPIWVRWPIYLVSILTIFVFGIWGSGYDAAGFIYFQF